MGDFVLLGQYRHAIDDKGRITIPAKFRNKLGRKLIVSKGFDGCLVLRSADEFIQWQKSILAQSENSKDVRILQRQILSNSNEIDVDSSGRIKIEENLLNIANIAKVTKEVMLVGVGNKVEIWNESSWQNFVSSSSADFEAIAEKLG